MYKELLWVFGQLPGDYVVVDTETTGLPDANGLPDIVTLGLSVVKNRQVTQTLEFETRPQCAISAEAQAVHGISNEQAVAFEPFAPQWRRIAAYLKDQLIVIHNASFDWPILLDNVARHRLTMPAVEGLFCSQKAATPWAQAMKLPCSDRGPPLDTLTKVLDVEDLRGRAQGTHGAAIDSLQTARVVETMRRHSRIK